MKTVIKILVLGSLPLLLFGCPDSNNTSLPADTRSDPSSQCTPEEKEAVEQIGGSGCNETSPATQSGEDAIHETGKLLPNQIEGIPQSA
jgi:hypothetical protein